MATSRRADQAGLFDAFEAPRLSTNMKPGHNEFGPVCRICGSGVKPHEKGGPRADHAFEGER
jgi:hypothetical protein